jgi:hypothetical protein
MQNTKTYNNTKPSTPSTSPPLNTTSTVFNSGGIGLDQKDWEDLHGMRMPSSNGMFEYKYDKYSSEKLKIGFSPELRINYIEWRDSGNLASLNFRELLPSDAKCTQKNPDKDSVIISQTVELCNSESLKSRFSKSDFTRGNGEDFIIIYSIDMINNRITSFVFQLGGN